MFDLMGGIFLGCLARPFKICRSDRNRASDVNGRRKEYETGQQGFASLCCNALLPLPLLLLALLLELDRRCGRIAIGLEITSQ